MIYGYDSNEINEFGLKEMREISISCTSDELCELAEFLVAAAEELRIAEPSHWHAHAPQQLAKKMGCDVIIVKPEGG